MFSTWLETPSWQDALDFRMLVMELEQQTWGTSGKGMLDVSGKRANCTPSVSQCSGMPIFGKAAFQIRPCGTARHAPKVGYLRPAENSHFTYYI